MDKGLEKLLNQINDLESKNRLINIQIEELKTTESEMQRKEKELISEIESINKQLKCMEKEEIELNNDISRVDLICKNVEATLHNEFVKVEIAAQKINQVEDYYEENKKKINDDLMKSYDNVKNCLLNMNDTNDDLNKLKEIKNNYFLLDNISLEELYEIYEETKEKYQNNSFKNQCDKFVIVDYKTHTYFCNPSHLLNMIKLLAEKIKESNDDPHFNFASMANYCGLKEQKKDDQIENFGLSELNKIMISHYKSKKISVNGTV